MSNTRYLRCAKCGAAATPRKYDPASGRLAETGTSTLMRCPDCASSDGYANMCRACCPTGHQTHADAEDGLDAEEDREADARNDDAESV